MQLKTPVHSIYNFTLDIANDIKTVEGLELIDELVKYEQVKHKKNKLKQAEKHKDDVETFIDPISNKEVQLRSIDPSSFKHEYHFFREYYQNIKKLLISNIRDPQQTAFRALNYFNFPIVLYLIMNRTFGKETGCTFLPANETHILSENTYARYDRQFDGQVDCCLVFSNLMFAFFSAMSPATLVLTTHINLLKKEYSNSYYTLHSFFWALITVNVLLGLVYSMANSISFLLFTNFAFDFQKFCSFWFIIFLLGNIGDLIGLWLSILYPEDANKIKALSLGRFDFSIY